MKEQEENLKLRKKAIEEEIENIGNIKENINKNIYELKKLEENNKKDSEKFQEYLEENKKYIEVLRNTQELKKDLEKNQLKEKEFKQIKVENENNFKVLEQSIQNTERLKEELEKKNEEVPSIEKGQRLEQTLEELEKIYQEINNKILKNGEEIKLRIDKANRIMASREKDLSRDYADVKGKYEDKVYREEEEDSAKEIKEQLENELNTLNKEQQDIALEKMRVITKKEEADKKLNKLGKSEPIQAHLIKGEYDNRRKEIKEQIQNINAELINLSKEIKSVSDNKSRILGKIDEPQYREVDISNFDYHNVKIQELAKNLTDKEKENDDRKRKIDNLYNEIESRNHEKDQVIHKFLNNMNPYQNENKFANYYFTYERVIECSNMLKLMLSALQTTIANIENDKNNIKHHAYIQGKNIYLEMKQISDSSDIKMPGKLRKVPLLEIELPKELDQFAEERINEYIEECINRLREECSEQENIRQIVEKGIKDWLSDRQLLNIVINTENIGVKLYKIDISEKNSGLKKWEDVVIDNSGGEKLISCLILVLALIQYTRRKVLAKYGESEKIETSKFLIIDNPFGKMSSTHLLDGLMLILKKFNVQAICLSDISQSSITNQFKIIYQLSLKNGKYTDKIYLTTDNIIKSPEITQNYLLEQAYVRSDAQVKLWE